MKSEKEQRSDRVAKKREYLNELETQQRMYRNLVERNKRTPLPDTAERVHLPFVVVHTKQNTCAPPSFDPFPGIPILSFVLVFLDVLAPPSLLEAIECEMSEDRTEYFFDFSQPFSIHDDVEVLRRMGLDDADYVAKLERSLHAEAGKR